MTSIPITMQPSEEIEIRELYRMLHVGDPPFIGRTDERLELPVSVYNLLKDVVSHMVRGRTMVLTPQANRLTTQAAANFLGFSRPHLIKLLYAGVIPFEKVGQHRRIRLQDLILYSKRRDAERRAGLNALAKAEYDEGSYEGIPIPEGGSDE